MPAEASSILVNLSANLSLNHTYDSAVIAIEAVAYEAVNVSGFSQITKCFVNFRASTRYRALAVSSV
jgi:hypothetical protein